MRAIRWRAWVIGGVLLAVGPAVAGTTGALASRPAGTSGSADPVLVWSGYAEQAVVAGRPPASSAVLLGTVHVGMYDAAVALGLPAQPFLARERTARGTSAATPNATVSHPLLVARVPGQRETVDAQYVRYLADLPDGPARRAGVSLGERVAARVLRWRAGDGLDAEVPYVQRPPGPGVWQPTAPTPPVDLVLTQVRPLASHRSSRRPR